MQPHARKDLCFPTYDAVQREIAESVPRHDPEIKWDPFSHRFPSPSPPPTAGLHERHSPARNHSPARHHTQRQSSGSLQQSPKPVSTASRIADHTSHNYAGVTKHRSSSSPKMGPFLEPRLHSVLTGLYLPPDLRSSRHGPHLPLTESAARLLKITADPSTRHSSEPYPTSHSGPSQSQSNPPHSQVHEAVTAHGAREPSESSSSQIQSQHDGRIHTTSLSAPLTAPPPGTHHTAKAIEANTEGHRQRRSESRDLQHSSEAAPASHAAPFKGTKIPHTPQGPHSRAAAAAGTSSHSPAAREKPFRPRKLPGSEVSTICTSQRMDLEMKLPSRARDGTCPLCSAVWPVFKPCDGVELTN